MKIIKPTSTMILLAVAVLTFYGCAVNSLQGSTAAGSGYRSSTVEDARSRMGPP